METTIRKNFTGIDIGKFVFACLIPFLHISFCSAKTSG